MMSTKAIAIPNKMILSDNPLHDPYNNLTYSYFFE
jgi:hypothetical protein